MIHTKFRGNQSNGSGELDFEGFLPYMGMAAIWSCNQQPIFFLLKFPFTLKLTHKL